MSEIKLTKPNTKDILSISIKPIGKKLSFRIMPIILRTNKVQFCFAKIHLLFRLLFRNKNIWQKIIANQKKVRIFAIGNQ
jgi:hypothetical protein